jgi:hypothetical protein
MDMDNRPDVDQMLQRMATLRNRLNYDAQAAQETIRDLTDWRHLVRKAPWKCVGTALVAGYLLVPRQQVRRKLTGEELERLSDHRSLLVTSEDSASNTLMGTVWGLVGASLARAASNYMATRLTGLVPRAEGEGTTK